MDDFLQTEEPLTEEEKTAKSEEEHLFWKELETLGSSPYYTPTKPVTQRYRIQIYSILAGISLAAGLFADHEFLFLGMVIIIKGIDLLVFRLRHGWHWTLTDKYLMLAGAAISYLSYKDGRFMGYKNLDEYALFGFLGTLGIVYPLIMMLELGLKKLRCRRKEDANVIDFSDSFFSRLPGGGVTVTPHFCPVYQVWRNGQETYLCDEWFTKSWSPHLYGDSRQITIRVHPRRDTEIYDTKRVWAHIKQQWKAWLIYDAIVFSIWVSPNLILLDLAAFVYLADRHYKKTGEEQ